jgi:hypothetical protein
MTHHKLHCDQVVADNHPHGFLPSPDVMNMGKFWTVDLRKHIFSLFHDLNPSPNDDVDFDERSTESISHARK